MATGTPSVDIERVAQAEAQPHLAQVPMDRAERQLWECVLQSIAAAERADRELMALAATALSESAYVQIANAALDDVDRATAAPFAEWKRATRRKVGDLP